MRLRIDLENVVLAQLRVSPLPLDTLLTQRSLEWSKDDDIQALKHMGSMRRVADGADIVGSRILEEATRIMGVVAVEE